MVNGQQSRIWSDSVFAEAVAISRTVTRATHYRTQCRLAIVDVATYARHDVSWVPIYKISYDLS